MLQSEEDKFMLEGLAIIQGACEMRNKLHPDTEPSQHCDPYFAIAFKRGVEKYYDTKRGQMNYAKQIDDYSPKALGEYTIDDLIRWYNDPNADTLQRKMYFDTVVQHAKWLESIKPTEFLNLKEIRDVLWEAKDSLQYVNNLYPENSGGGVRAERIEKIEKLLEKLKE